MRQVELLIRRFVRFKASTSSSWLIPRCRAIVSDVWRPPHTALAKPDEVKNKQSSSYEVYTNTARHSVITRVQHDMFTYVCFWNRHVFFSNRFSAFQSLLQNVQPANQFRRFYVLVNKFKNLIGLRLNTEKHC